MTPSTSSTPPEQVLKAIDTLVRILEREGQRQTAKAIATEAYALVDSAERDTIPLGSPESKDKQFYLSVENLLEEKARQYDHSRRFGLTS